MFYSANALVPFAGGCLIPLLMDWHAAPHRESVRMKALMSLAFAMVFVILFHILTDSRDSLRVIVPLGLASALLGTLFTAAMRKIRGRLAALVPASGPTVSKAGPRERQQMPPQISGAREYSPISFKKRPRGGPGKAGPQA